MDFPDDGRRPVADCDLRSEGHLGGVQLAVHRDRNIANIYRSVTPEVADFVQRVRAVAFLSAVAVRDHGVS
jgi:hypothetical protein